MQCPPKYLMAAFWGCLALNSVLRAPIWFIAAGGCLGGYYLWIGNWHRYTIRGIQKSIGLSDAEIAEKEKVWAKEAAERQEAETRKKEEEREEARREEAYRARPSLSRVKVDLTQTAAQSFPAEENGTLVSHPGPVSVELEMESFKWDEGIVAFRCRTFVCDSEGEEWLSETLARAGSFLAPLDDPDSQTFHSWEQAPPSWLGAIGTQCVLAELVELLDSREYHELEIDGKRFAYFEKYQGPRVDLA